ncbi:MAG: hypothetical protein LLG14_12145 [Nocardiaceae bacterium]|nr:hypothetical protein [Nocardiaceae bacterium]
MTTLSATATVDSWAKKCPRIEMKILNSTSKTLHLQGLTNPDGEWVTEPPTVLRPHQSAVISAVSGCPDGFSVTMSYRIGKTCARADFTAHNHTWSGGAGTATTGVIGSKIYDVFSHLDSGSPVFSAEDLLS